MYVLNSPELSFAPGTDVAVSPDGSIVGFGAPLRGGFGAFLYRNDAAPWCVRSEEKELRVSYTPLVPQNFTWALHVPVAQQSGDGVEILARGGWPSPIRRIPSGSRRDDSSGRALQLQVESEYNMNDPSMLTFVDTICVPIQNCTGIHVEEPEDLAGAWGVVFDGVRVAASNVTKSGTHCPLVFSFRRP